ncbi:MAG: dienelactone hydrolase family protein, partial [Pseudomonadota bacterium]|nr:dienelactone hydrolase family protein [Pseudomonadota bacterium]
MCDSDDKGFIVDTSLTRRSMVAGLSAATGAGALPGAALAAYVVERDVMVNTSDWLADAALF